jgi:hypothetical protein
MVDIKQYIVSILHFDFNVEMENIDYAIVDEIIFQLQNDPSKRNKDIVGSLYFKSNNPDSISEENHNTANDDEKDLISISAQEGKLNNPPDEIEINLEMSEPVKNTNQSQQVSVKNIPGKPINLPNAKVNEEYFAELPLSSIGLDNIHIVSIEKLETCGLSYNNEKIAITGNPNLSGEHSFVLNYRLTPDDQTKPVLQRLVNIYINPDPRTLWTEHEPDANSPFPKAHIAKSELECFGKRVSGASKRGRSHAKDAKFRDDHFEFHHDAKTDWLAITVSDGAGSAKLSREGSKIMCQTVIAELFHDSNKEKFNEIDKYISEVGISEKTEHEIKSKFYFLIGNALVKGYKEIEESAKLINATVKDYSCTFLLALIKKINDKWCVVGYWVGDGGIGIYLENNDPIILGNPDSGEFSGQTRFVTMPEMLKSAEEIFNRIHVVSLTEFKGIWLMTDGISDAWFHTDANLFKKSYWDDIWNDLKSKHSSEDQDKVDSNVLLEWLDFWVKGEYDDRTLVIYS